MISVSEQKKKKEEIIMGGNKTSTLFQDELERVRTAIANGNLNERCSADKVDEKFKPLVSAVNGIVEAFTTPLDALAAEAGMLSRSSRGRQARHTW